MKRHTRVEGLFEEGEELTFYTPISQSDLLHDVNLLYLSDLKEKKDFAEVYRYLDGTEILDTEIINKNKSFSLFHMTKRGIFGHKSKLYICLMDRYIKHIFYCRVVPTPLWRYRVKRMVTESVINRICG